MPNNFTLTWACIAALGFVLVGGWGGWTVNGWRMQSENSTLKADHAKESERLTKELLEANERVQLTNDTSREIVDQIASSRRREKANDQEEIKRLTAAVRTGAVRLSIATKAAAHSASSCASTTAASGVTEARADIDGGAAATLIGITDRGDQAIKDLNQCIDSYDAVRAKINSLNAH